MYLKIYIIVLNAHKLSTLKLIVKYVYKGKFLIARK